MGRKTNKKVNAQAEEVKSHLLTHIEVPLHGVWFVQPDKLNIVLNLLRKHGIAVKVITTPAQFKKGCVNLTEIPAVARKTASQLSLAVLDKEMYSALGYWRFNEAPSYLISTKEFKFKRALCVYSQELLVSMDESLKLAANHQEQNPDEDGDPREIKLSIPLDHLL